MACAIDNWSMMGLSNHFENRCSMVDNLLGKKKNSAIFVHDWFYRKCDCGTETCSIQLDSWICPMNGENESIFRLNGCFFFLNGSVLILYIIVQTHRFNVISARRCARYMCVIYMCVYIIIYNNIFSSRTNAPYENICQILSLNLWIVYGLVWHFDECLCASQEIKNDAFRTKPYSGISVFAVSFRLLGLYMNSWQKHM